MAKLAIFKPRKLTKKDCRMNVLNLSSRQEYRLFDGIKKIFVKNAHLKSRSLTVKKNLLKHKYSAFSSKVGTKKLRKNSVNSF